MTDDIIIKGQATLEWGDQLRFLLRRLRISLLMLAVVMTPVFGTIWAMDLSGREWLVLRARPLAALGDFLADAWLHVCSSDRGYDRPCLFCLSPLSSGQSPAQL